MAGRWQDEQQQQWRARDDEPWYYGRDGESRSFGRERPDKYGARRSGLNRDPVFGERESGASYGGPRGQAQGSPRFTSQDYTGGGRYYGDDSRDRIYREEYGQGGREYGDVPRGYDADRNYGRQAYDRGGYGEAGYGDYPGEYRRETRRPASGAMGYDAGRGYGGASERREARSERVEDAGRHAGEFLHRAGERVAAWFGGGGEARAYHDDAGHDHRGRGPQGYKRSDERISDDLHDRLTDDRWLDASGIVVAVAGGEVTLSGTVDDRDAKHRAEHLAEAVPGVVHVQNNLRLASRDVVAPLSSTDDAVANGTGGAGGGQSTAGRKDLS